MNTSVKWTPSVGPCLSLLPLYQTLYKTDISLRQTLIASPKGVHLRKSCLYFIKEIGISMLLGTIQLSSIFFRCFDGTSIISTELHHAQGKHVLYIPLRILHI